AVPERLDAHVRADANVVAHAEHGRGTRLRNRDAARGHADLAHTDITVEIQAAGLRRIEANLRRQRANRKTGAFLFLRPAVRAHAGQEPRVDRGAQRQRAAQAALATIAVLAAQRTVAETHVEPEALTALGLRCAR